jgi:hypothetical protein
MVEAIDDVVVTYDIHMCEENEDGKYFNQGVGEESPRAFTKY